MIAALARLKPGERLIIGRLDEVDTVEPSSFAGG
jgi:hypothetical protein